MSANAGARTGPRAAARTQKARTLAAAVGEAGMALRTLAQILRASIVVVRRKSSSAIDVVS
jgi:hypothetical protein